MTNMGRRMGAATLAVLHLCLALTGCLSPEDEFQPFVSPSANNPAPRSAVSANIAAANAMERRAGAVYRPAARPDYSAMEKRPGGLYRPSAQLPPDDSDGVVVAAGEKPSDDAPIQKVGFRPQFKASAVSTTDGDVGPAGPLAAPPPGYLAEGPRPLPNELTMSSHPPYRVAPPDILIIDALRVVPKGPYRLEPLEVLQVMVDGTVPTKPISGAFMITPEGQINLGYDYGAIRVGGLTLDQAQKVIYDHLSNQLKNPTVNLAVAQFRGLQQIAGQHLVRPDGTISLGTYGSVYVAGLTMGQLKCELEKYLSAYLVTPQLSVDVLAYNSQKIFVIVDGGGFGQQVIPLPVTGNETVLDAVSRVYGLAPVSSKKRIWVARPSPGNLGCNIILPVDWQAITMNGQTVTNYQLFPGDRVFIGANKLICFNNYLSQVLAPVEQIFGVTLLGSNTVRSLTQSNNSNNGFLFVP